MSWSMLSSEKVTCEMTVDSMGGSTPCSLSQAQGRRSCADGGQQPTGPARYTAVRVDMVHPATAFRRAPALDATGAPGGHGAGRSARGDARPPAVSRPGGLPAAG